MALLSHLWDFFFYFKIRCVTITGKGLAGSRAVGGNYLKKRIIIILAVISLAFFVIFDLPFRFEIAIDILLPEKLLQSQESMACSTQAQYPGSGW